MATQHKHSVQFFGKDRAQAANNAGAFFAGTLEDGGGAVVIAAEDRRNAIVAECERRLGPGAAARITCLDAAETLEKFMVANRPDPACFNRVVGGQVRQLVGQHKGLRAYGEMVGLLWDAGEPSAAIALEEQWNDLLASVNFELFCGYPIDVASPVFQIATVDALLSTHDAMTAATPQAFRDALENAIDETLGPRAAGLRLGTARSRKTSWPNVPESEETILWLRNAHPRRADEILLKAKSSYAG